MLGADYMLEQTAGGGVKACVYSPCPPPAFPQLLPTVLQPHLHICSSRGHLNLYIIMRVGLLEVNTGPVMGKEDETLCNDIIGTVMDPIANPSGEPVGGWHALGFDLGK